jgi:hypothetical protein
MVNQFTKWFVDEVVARVEKQNAELQRLKEIEEKFNHIINLSTTLTFYCKGDYDRGSKWLEICQKCGNAIIEQYQRETFNECHYCHKYVCNECCYEMTDESEDDDAYPYCCDCVSIM